MHPCRGYWNTAPLVKSVHRAPVKWIYYPCPMDLKTVRASVCAQITTPLQCVSVFSDVLHTAFNIVFPL